MNIIDGIKLKGKGIEIPDCSRNDLPQFCIDMGYKTGVEIGVYKGEFLIKFCEVGLNMYGIDPWKSYREYSEELKDFQARQDFLYGHAQRLLSVHKNVTLIRKTSMEAVEDFKDGSLDFVYIDGHHGFKFIAEDMWDWSLKVRKGGMVSGHDYAINDKRANDPYVLHVKWVVDAFTEALRIPNWYVLGRHNAEEGEKRDKYRSWMWIKE